MALVPAKCPECGGNINIDSEKKAGICEYCKQPFVVQEAIQNFNTTYNITNNNEIKADIVNVYESNNSEFEIEAGVLKKYKGAETIVRIPDGVMAIAPSCFEGMEYLKEIVITEGVRKIDDLAFAYCKDLSKVTLPSTIEDIYVTAFMTCAVEELIVPDEVDEEVYIYAFRKTFQDKLDQRAKKIALSDEPYYELFPNGLGISNLIDASHAGAQKVSDGGSRVKHGFLIDFICSERNPVQTSSISNPLKWKRSGRLISILGAYGHYFYLQESYPYVGDDYFLVYCKECFSTTKQLEDYIKQQDAIFIEECKRQKKCPYCGRGNLNIFGKCKSCGKQI